MNNFDSKKEYHDGMFGWLHLPVKTNADPLYHTSKFLLLPTPQAVKNQFGLDTIAGVVV